MADEMSGLAQEVSGFDQPIEQPKKDDITDHEAAIRAMARAGKELAHTWVGLYDMDPEEMREMLVSSWDAEVSKIKRLDDAGN